MLAKKIGQLIRSMYNSFLFLVMGGNLFDIFCKLWHGILGITVCNTCDRLYYYGPTVYGYRRLAFDIEDTLAT